MQQYIQFLLTFDKKVEIPPLNLIQEFNELTSHVQTVLKREPFLRTHKHSLEVEDPKNLTTIIPSDILNKTNRKLGLALYAVENEIQVNKNLIEKWWKEIT